jgi:hypothetical protein
MLEYWSDGIKGFWEMGNWDIARFLLRVKSIKEYFSLKSTFRYSIIPLPHVLGINIKPY